MAEAFAQIAKKHEVLDVTHGGHTPQNAEMLPAPQEPKEGKML